MAGLTGGGGLGQLAYNYGYQRFDTTVMIVTIVLIVILVQAIQWIGDAVARRVDHRSAATAGSKKSRRHEPATVVGV
jgi:D-methionine transport system permease protein